MKFLWAIIMILIILLFPQKAYCGHSSALSYIKYDALGDLSWYTVENSLPNAPHIKMRIESSLTSLFNGNYPGTYTYPENISVLSINYLFGHISINLSGEFGNFGGGSMLETIYLTQIVKTLLDIEGVEKVTLLVDGLTGNTPEGIVIKEVSSWQELTEGIIMKTEP